MPQRSSPASDRLFRFIQDRAPQTASRLDASPPAPFPRADEYLCASLLQKAVRRGDLVIARRAGHQLYGLDRQRLWRRLAVIALEDIGIADLGVMAELVAIATMPTARRLYGGDVAALDHALARACGAVKDRTADHAGSVVGREPMDGDDRTLKAASQNALMAVVASSAAPWSRRSRAAVMVTGRGGDPGYPIAGATDALFEVFRDMGVPDLLLAACTAYAASQRDALPVFVPLAWCLWSGCTGSDEPVIHKVPAAELVADLPSYAFDPVNTRLGRRAVDLFLRAHLMKPPYPPRMVAAAIWNTESAMCDRTLSWPVGEEIRRRAFCADLTYRGLPEDRHAALNDWIARERPALIAARQAVWNSLVRQSGKPAEALEQAYLPLPVPEGRSRRG